MILLIDNFQLQVWYPELGLVVFFFLRVIGWLWCGGWIIQIYWKENLEKSSWDFFWSGNEGDELQVDRELLPHHLPYQHAPRRDQDGVKLRKTPWVEFPWWSNLFQRSLSSPGVHVSLLLVILFGSLGVYLINVHMLVQYSYHGFMISPPRTPWHFSGVYEFPAVWWGLASTNLHLSDTVWDGRFAKSLEDTILRPNQVYTYIYIYILEGCLRASNF